MWKIISFFWLEKCYYFCEFLHCFLLARNAQVTFAEKPQMKMNRLEIQIAVFAWIVPYLTLTLMYSPLNYNKQTENLSTTGYLF